MAFRARRVASEREHNRGYHFRFGLKQFDRLAIARSISAEPPPLFSPSQPQKPLAYVAHVPHHRGMHDLLLPPAGQFLRERAIRGGMDLLFFANTRHLKRADERLAALGLGRAHHRILYFVARRPDITVGDLLGILAITKQSAGRVTNMLVRTGLIEVTTGVQDRRQRLLRLTPAGIDLEQEIFDDLHANVERAYTLAGGEAVAGFWAVMQHLMGEEAQRQFRMIHEADIAAL
jgi:DNA-binding MarR family transcriptional regulator